MMDDQTIACGLRRLRGQICTPPLFNKRLLAEIRERDYARFIEWPSGHWKITERGSAFLSDLGGDT